LRKRRAEGVRQVGAGKASESKPLMKCRESAIDIETRQWR
jgi:hypothetical protein